MSIRPAGQTLRLSIVNMSPVDATAFENHSATEHITAVGPKLQPIVAEPRTSGSTPS